MTRDRYLNMCEQMGKEPVDSEIPPDWDDIPEVAQDAINIFNQLGDRVFPEIGYIGKDYTNLQILLNTYLVDNTELCLDVLSWLDTRAIKESARKLKQEYDKLKRKNSGQK